MAKEAKFTNYKVSDLYQGGYSSLDPNKSYGNVFTGYRVGAGNFALTTDPRNANMLQEVSSKLSSGVKHIEVEGLSPEVFESVPQQHLKEINRLSKLTGVNITVHGPLVEPAGFTREGYSDANREAAERQMKQAIARAHEMSPDGSFPVTFHSSAILPGPEVEMTKNGVEQKGILIINPETGAINKMPLKERFFPGEKGKPEVKVELAKINEEKWKSEITHLAYNTERASQYIDNAGPPSVWAKYKESEGEELSPELKKSKTNFTVGKAFLQDSYREFKELYNQAYKYGTSEDKKMLDDLSKEITKKVEVINKNPGDMESVNYAKEIVENGLSTLEKLQKIPELFKPLNEFAQDKTTTTFANVALDSYKKFKDKAPIISIENPPAGGAFSTGEDLKNIVEESRRKFVEAAKKEGISEGEAKRQAERLIGVTWDVGHINMLRKQGYEEKDIIKETEKIAPLLKNVHLSDNFGFEHTELPMGMGNVPIKEIMEKLGKKGFEAKKVIEAGNWWQHFKTSPVQETLEAFGSPIYAMKAAPYWNQYPGLEQGYFSGYGATLPQINYETFGGGFSQLPSELGGQRQGAGGGRMSGRPME